MMTAKLNKTATLNGGCLVYENNEGTATCFVSAHEVQYLELGYKLIIDDDGTYSSEDGRCTLLFSNGEVTLHLAW